MNTSSTLLLTDVVDSTQLNAQLGDAVMAPLWAAHDRAARELVRLWHGREVGRSDGFLLLFDRASDAIGFAMGYHRALATLTLPLKARVGVHTGPVDLRENPPHDRDQGATPFEVDGLALPAAARVMSAAEGGQTLLSADAVRALGPTPLRLLSHGYWRLKGLAEPMELFEIGESGNSDAPFKPPADTAKAYRVVHRDGQWRPVRELPHTLPAERDAFVGRADALRALAGHFDAGARLVTLLGMGGIGKTRLAQRYAREWLGEFAGGAWFCDLSAARSADGIVHAVAKGLDVPLGRADPVQQLGAAMAGRGPCLVILDNFEQVARHAEDTLGVWLQRAPQASFIATSREVLGIVGEQVLALAPLENAEAVAMFRLRVRAVGVDAAFSSDDEAALVPLMELLDRLPLAIELAAARARLMPPLTLLQRMGDRFKLLATRSGRRDRQATMRGALDWSWALLSTVEQSALAQLSVFEGGFTLDAAEAVVDLSAYRSAPEVVNVVQALVEKSLVRAAEAQRFDLLGTVHDYAAEQLLAAASLHAATGQGEASSAQTRHGDFFAAWAERASVAQLVADLNNLVVATRAAARSGRARTATGALQGAWEALKLRGPFRGVIELAEGVRAMPGLDPASSARVDWVLGWALKAYGRVAEAQARLLSAQAGASAAGDLRCAGRVASLLGDLHRNAGRQEDARREFTAALDLAGRTQDDLLECEARTGLGNLFRHLGSLDNARSEHQQALAAARRASDQRWEGGSLGNLGVLFADQGRLDEAHACFDQALSIARALGDRQWEGNTLCNLGLTHHNQGRYEAAAGELELALTAARQLGHVRLECVVQCNLGMTAEAMQKPLAAGEHFEAALQLARSLDDRRLEGQVLGYLGLLRARQGRIEVGRALMKQGEALLLALSDRLSVALLHCSLAECEQLAGDTSAALTALAAAESAADSLGAAAAGSELQLSIHRVRGQLAASGAAP